MFIHESGQTWTYMWWCVQPQGGDSCMLALYHRGYSLKKGPHTTPFAVKLQKCLVKVTRCSINTLESADNDVIFSSPLKVYRRMVQMFERSRHEDRPAGLGEGSSQWTCSATTGPTIDNYVTVNNPKGCLVVLLPCRYFPTQIIQLNKFIRLVVLLL